jgi:F0F1-type ATP synthase assembly protein I
MDFRFKYDRRPPPPEVEMERKRQQQQAVLGGRQLAYGLAIPSIMVSGPLGGWLLGNFLDNLLGTQFVMILLILIGTASSLKLVIDMLTRLSDSSR